MEIVWIHGEGAEGGAERWGQMGWRVVEEGWEEVRGLTAETVERVYVVEAGMLGEEAWADWRLALARASRYFVVGGRGLGTREMMRAVRDGAYEVVDWEEPRERWREAVERAGLAQRLWLQLYGAGGGGEEEILVGRSAGMRQVRESIQRVGPTAASVLILGESGTGKERVAEALHKAFGRGRMVAVNCAAIPAELMESELFGVEKGAFTGANRDKPGLVEEADGGILFLDEIGELPLGLQPKLLRFLENGTARRVGSNRDYRVAVRVLAATNRDLRTDAEAGRFRLDLYYRLSEVVLNVPPLRERPEDIPDLAQLFLRGAGERLGKVFEQVEPGLIRKFQAYRWPGNVRELKQTLERLAIHYDGPMMREEWWSLPAGAAGGPRGGEGQAVSQAGANAMQTAFPGRAMPLESRPGTVPGEGGGAAGMGGQGAGAGFGAGMAGPAGMGAGWPGPGGMGPGWGFPGVGQVPGGGFPGFTGGWNPPPGWGGQVNRLPGKRERMEMARELLRTQGDDLTWVAAQVGVHPTTLYRWRKLGKV